MDWLLSQLDLTLINTDDLNRLHTSYMHLYVEYRLTMFALIVCLAIIVLLLFNTAVLTYRLDRAQRGK